MKISDSLRQECMPEMIYTICKLAGKKTYTRDRIRDLITLESDSGNTQEYNKAYHFAEECGFITEDGANIVSTPFSEKELSTFRFFRYAIFMNIFKENNTLFNSLAKWFLSQDQSVFSLKSADDLMMKFPRDLFEGKEKDFALGFRFWMVALGMGMFSKSGNSNCLVFATNNIIKDWLEISKPFPKNKIVLAKDFFEKLIVDCPVFETCLNGNNVNTSLSMGLRVLYINNIIDLKYITDSGDMWQLVDSVSYPQTNKITEIIVR